MSIFIDKILYSEHRIVKDFEDLHVVKFYKT